MYSNSISVNMLYFGRRLMKWAVGKDHLLGRDCTIKKVRLGSNYGGWFVNEDAICQKQNVNVISLGIGRDITFDLELVEKFGATVHAFDPTPLSVEYIGKLNLPFGMYTHQVGIAANDGEMEFGLPLKDGWDSYSAFDMSRGSVKCPVKHLNGIIAISEFDYIDVFKMDIEGCEYDVLDDLIASKIRPGQLLIEFHYNNNVTSKTHLDVISNIETLRKIGYSVFDVSPWGREFSLIRNDLVR